MRVRSGVLLAVIVLIWLPMAAQTRRAPSLAVPVQQFTLPNGLSVILHQDRTVPVVAVNLWYRVGSANERAGRTGFAHLFEHLMFEGSKHVDEGAFDTLLEAAGGSNNGSTDYDHTKYYEDVPANALELALFLESDRMGYLLDAMSPARVDGQRDVVKNERRQSYENQPYGMAALELEAMLWPKHHPYGHPTIGDMEDLTAASHDDVVAFFRQYYTPGNASLVIAGDIDVSRARALVERYFGEIPAGMPVPPVTAPPVALEGVTRRTITDRVRLPRLYLAWLTPAAFAPGEAALDVASMILAGGKSSRLYRRLVYDTQMAQDIYAYQQAARLGGSFQIVATARPGVGVDQIQRVVDEELARLRAAPPDARELARAINQVEASFYRQMERVGGYRGKANQLNAYAALVGRPDFFADDLARYTSLSAADVQTAARTWLPADRRVELVVEPEADR